MVRRDVGGVRLRGPGHGVGGEEESMSNDVNGVKLQRPAVEMLRLLADGRVHTDEELHGCLVNRNSVRNSIHFHLNAIRQHLRTKGEALLRIVDGRQTKGYQHVRVTPVAKE